MAEKPSYNELRKKVQMLERELAGQRSIEKLLWEKQDQLFKVLDSLEAIVYVADMQSYEILFANRYAEKIFGNITGKICWQVLQSGNTGPCRFCNNKKLVHPDGRLRDTVLWEMQNTVNGKWYSIRDRAIDWFDGRIVHLQIAFDISARKKAEAALQASEEKFRTVADFTYDWEYWINEKGAINYISPSCERITGYGVREFEENPDLLREIVHPGDKHIVGRHLDAGLETTEVCHLNFRIINRAGEERWISHYCQPVYGNDNKFLGRRASNRDISVQKKAEEKIKLNEIRLAGLVENIKLNEMRLTALLNLYEKQGLPVKEVCDFVLEASLPLTGSDIGFMGFINDDESLMTIHAWSKSVMTQCNVHEKPLVFSIADAGIWGEAVRRHQPVIINDYNASPLKKGIPDGHLGIMRFMAVPLLDKKKVVAVVAVGNKRNDYSEEDVIQLQLLIKGMWQIIKRREAEDDLIKQTEMIKYFTNTVAHDLKNPAVAIHGLARILMKKHGKLPRDKVENFLDQIVKSSEQMVSLSEDINTYISTREAPLHLTDLDLKPIWKSIREEFTPRLRKRKIELSEPELSSLNIRADKNSLLRIYRNLVDNALKYGGSGLSEITLNYESTPTHHILGVKNNGALIPQEQIDTVFDIFSRGADETAPAGTGLGLAIVKEIAKHHRGSAWVVSSSEADTTFYVSFAHNLK